MKSIFIFLLMTTISSAYANPLKNLSTGDYDMVAKMTSGGLLTDLASDIIAGALGVSTSRKKIARVEITPEEIRVDAEGLLLPLKGCLDHMAVRDLVRYCVTSSSGRSISISTSFQENGKTVEGNVEIIKLSNKRFKIAKKIRGSQSGEKTNFTFTVRP